MDALYGFFLEVPVGLDPQSGLLGGVSWLRSVRVRRALGQWSGGFKNYKTRNGTVFQASSMESWKDWKINAHVKRAER